MTTTTHFIGSADALAGGSLRSRVRRAVPGGTPSREREERAAAQLDKELADRLSPTITYRPGRGFYIDLPANLDDDDVDNEIASCEGIVLMELSDLLDDGGLGDVLAAAS